MISVFKCFYFGIYACDSGCLLFVSLRVFAGLLFVIASVCFVMVLACRGVGVRLLDDIVFTVKFLCLRV